MKNFDLKKYLAEGKLNEENYKTLRDFGPDLVSRLKGLGIDAKLFKGQMNVPQNAKDAIIKNPKLAAISYFEKGTNERIEIIVNKDKFDDLKSIKTFFDSLEGNIKRGPIVLSNEIGLLSYETKEGKLNENYEPGRGWTDNFDYDGMLNLASIFDINTPMDILLKVSSDMEDVNYHRENSYLTDAIDAIKDGNKQEAFIAFRMLKKEIAKLQESEIKENEIKEKPSTNNKMKKSELKEMIKMALSEDARTDAEQEGYKDGFDDAKDDIEAKLKDMKVSEAEEVDVEDNEDIDVDIEKEVDIDDESVESDIEVKGSMPGEDADEVAVQSLLMKAQEEAAKLGDEKLTDQIGNTITYFTRAHVATVDEAEEMDEIAAMPGEEGVEDVNIDDPAKDAMVGLTETLRWQRIAGIAKDNGLYDNLK